MKLKMCQKKKMWTTAKAMLRNSCVALNVYIRKAYSSKYQKNLKTENQTQKKVEGSIKNIK